MLQVSLALRESTERSLIILDEFGKGTATVSLTEHSVYDTTSKMGWSQSYMQVTVFST